ncbi:hypothetical protein [Pseudomonas akapageensis]|uniref:hypothetical protein n=1 Tax=Pseudomonas akapageensis TaxID=2609961 RepID=UPI001FE45353|nr:hypothetical protein [Pseudomonas akapageensis]
MRNPSATKWLLALLTVATLGQAAWISFSGESPPQLSKVVNKTPIGQNGFVYEVQSDSGGATVPFVYFYYVLERQASDEGALSALREKSPFLATRQSGAIVSVSGNRIRAHTQDTVYSFSSLAVYGKKDQTAVVIIDLDSVQP